MRPFDLPFHVLLFLLSLVPLLVGAVGIVNQSLSGIPLILFSLLAVLFFVRRSEKHLLVTMGVDGFSMRQRKKARFVSWTDFSHFEVAKRGIVARTKDGSTVEMGGAGLRDGAQSIEQKFIQRPETVNALTNAAEEWQHERTRPRLSELLEGQAEDDWGRILERALDGDFRTNGITQSQLEEDLLHPDTPPPLRELLAKNLRVRVEEAAVEEAIEAFASERSQKALKALLTETS